MKTPRDSHIRLMSALVNVARDDPRAAPKVLLAAVVGQACEDAIAGDSDAWRWIETESQPYLSHLCPAAIEPEQLHRQLCDMVALHIAERSELVG